MPRTDVAFPSGGGSCAAWLYVPDSAPASGPLLVMGHGLGGVRSSWISLPGTSRYAPTGGNLLTGHRAERFVVPWAGRLLPMERTYTWQHVDNPSIQNKARVQLHQQGLSANGTQVGEGYEAAWELRAEKNWVTQNVEVNVVGDGWERHLELVRTETGEWSSTTKESGTQPDDLPPPGLVQPADLETAVDCDLGLCPLTNTMPIRRLRLLEENVPETPLIMAWIDMPSLQVIASDQYYSSIDSLKVRYASGTRGVDVELEVDEDGVVVHYPDMARRV